VRNQETERQGDLGNHQQDGTSSLGDEEKEDVVEEVHEDISQENRGGIGAIIVRIIWIRSKKTSIAIGQL
jgi:hypothetical protein